VPSCFLLTGQLHDEAERAALVGGVATRLGQALNGGHGAP
jgi:hypothetical protein